MKVAIFGCLHGLLNEMYQTVLEHEKQFKMHVDFILVCGDCQTIRHFDDLRCLAVPAKYKRLGDFHEYYSGKKRIPKLTICVGGNHEASNYLMTMPYGGWICDNFYYLGYAGVINYKGLRIAGISGIFNPRDSNRGRFERMPLDDNTKRSIYHCRRLDVFRLQLLSQRANKDCPIDVLLSHDWPARIYNHGDVEQLLRFKPHFRSDVNSHNGLGNPLTEPLVYQLKPRRWFAAHLHCRFYAKVDHEESNQQESTGAKRCTEFLSLNKIDKGLRYVEYMDLHPVKYEKSKMDANDQKDNAKTTQDPNAGEPALVEDTKTKTSDEVVKQVDDTTEGGNLCYDAEWLTILRKTIELENSSYQNQSYPDLENGFKYVPSDEDIQSTIEMMNLSGGLIIKKNFQMSEPVIYDRPDNSPPSLDKNRCKYFPNPQHEELCSRLQIKCQLHQQTVNSDDRSRQDHIHNQIYIHPNASSSYHGGTIQSTPTCEHRSSNTGVQQPSKKIAYELDEDGCLPCYTDRKGES